MRGPFFDNEDKRWHAVGEYRRAGPFEYYVIPFTDAAYPVVKYSGERRTEGKVFIVVPRSSIASKTWSNH